MAEKLVARDSSSVRFRTSLAVSLHRLAAIVLDDDESLSAARRSTEIFQAFGAGHAEGDRRGWISTIAMNHYNRGHHHYAKGRKSEAIDAFLAARAAYDELDSLGDRGAVILELAAKNLLYLCRAYNADKQFDNGVAAGRQAVAILQKLVADHPANFEYGHQLFLANSESGFMSMSVKNWDGAIASYAEARKTLKDMRAKHGHLVSRMATIQGWLAELDHNLKEAYDSDLVRYAGPRKDVVRETYEICDKLGVVGPLSRNLRVAYAVSCVEMAYYAEEDGDKPDLELFRRAERLWAEFLRDGQLVSDACCWLVIIRRKLANELTARGQNDEAMSWRSQSLSTARGDSALCYDIAREYANRIKPLDHVSTQSKASRAEHLRRQFVADALAMLHEAIAAGFRDATQLRTDPRLAPLRSESEFQVILSGLEFPAEPFAGP